MRGEGNLVLGFTFLGPKLFGPGGPATIEGKPCVRYPYPNHICNFSHPSDNCRSWQVLETLESKIFAFPFADHLWFDLTPTPT